MKLRVEKDPFPSPLAASSGASNVIAMATTAPPAPLSPFAPSYLDAPLSCACLPSPGKERLGTGAGSFLSPGYSPGAGSQGHSCLRIRWKILKWREGRMKWLLQEFF